MSERPRGWGVLHQMFGTKVYDKKYVYIDSTDKEDKDLQHWYCNTDCHVEVKSPPLTMFAVKIGTSA